MVRRSGPRRRPVPALRVRWEVAVAAPRGRTDVHVDPNGRRPSSRSASAAGRRRRGRRPVGSRRDGGPGSRRLGWRRPASANALSDGMRPKARPRTTATRVAATEGEIAAGSGGAGGRVRRVCCSRTRQRLLLGWTQGHRRRRRSGRHAGHASPHRSLRLGAPKPTGAGWAAGSGRRDRPRGRCDIAVAGGRDLAFPRCGWRRAAVISVGAARAAPGGARAFLTGEVFDAAGGRGRPGQLGGRGQRARRGGRRYNELLMQARGCAGGEQGALRRPSGGRMAADFAAIGPAAERLAAGGREGVPRTRRSAAPPGSRRGWD